MMAMVMARRHDIGNAAMSKKVRCADIDIAYEVVGEGTPLVLLHLLFDTREFWWQAGYVDSLRKAGRQLVLIDASAHDKGPYSFASMANELPPDMRQRVRANDQLALAASVSEDRPDISERVASSKMRLLFFAGDKDPRHARCMEFARKTGSQFFTVAGAHHIQTLLCV
jgi:pimeloyl-ACP methyl ester carboxylesterase